MFFGWGKKTAEAPPAPNAQNSRQVLARSGSGVSSAASASEVPGSRAQYHNMSASDSFHQELKSSKPDLTTPFSPKPSASPPTSLANNQPVSSGNPPSAPATGLPPRVSTRPLPDGAPWYLRADRWRRAILGEDYDVIPGQPPALAAQITRTEIDGYYKRKLREVIECRVLPEDTPLAAVPSFASPLFAMVTAIARRSAFEYRVLQCHRTIMMSAGVGSVDNLPRHITLHINDNYNGIGDSSYGMGHGHHGMSDRNAMLGESTSHPHAIALFPVTSPELGKNGNSEDSSQYSPSPRPSSSSSLLAPSINVFASAAARTYFTSSRYTSSSPAPLTTITDSAVPFNPHKDPHPLPSPSQLHACAQIMVLVAARHPTLTCCPPLPDLAYLLLTLMSAAEAFACIETVVRRSLRSEQYLPTSAVGFMALARAASAILAKISPALHTHMCSLHIYPSALLYSWLSRLLVGVLPVAAVNRLMDYFVSEGIFALVTAAVTILAMYQDVLTRSLSPEHFHANVTAICQVDDVDGVLKYGRQLAITKKQIVAHMKTFMMSKPVILPGEMRCFRPPSFTLSNSLLRSQVVHRRADTNAFDSQGKEQRKLGLSLLHDEGGRRTGTTDRGLGNPFYSSAATTGGNSGSSNVGASWGNVGGLMSPGSVSKTMPPPESMFSSLRGTHTSTHSGTHNTGSSDGGGASASTSAPAPAITRMFSTDTSTLSSSTAAPTSTAAKWEGTGSDILSYSDFLVLDHWLPPQQRILSPVLLYSSSRHGYSLETLLQRVKGHGAHVMVVKHANGVLGCFNQQWRGSGNMFLDGRSFVFTLKPSFRFYPFNKYACVDEESDDDSDEEDSGKKEKSGKEEDSGIPESDVWGGMEGQLLQHLYGDIDTTSTSTSTPTSSLSRLSASSHTHNDPRHLRALNTQALLLRPRMHARVGTADALGDVTVTGSVVGADDTAIYRALGRLMGVVLEHPALEAVAEQASDRGRGLGSMGSTGISGGGSRSTYSTYTPSHTTLTSTSTPRSLASVQSTPCPHYASLLTQPTPRLLAYIERILSAQTHIYPLYGARKYAFFPSVELLQERASHYCGAEEAAHHSKAVHASFLAHGIDPAVIRLEMLPPHALDALAEGGAAALQIIKAIVQTPSLIKRKEQKEKEKSGNPPGNQENTLPGGNICTPGGTNLLELPPFLFDIDKAPMQPSLLPARSPQNASGITVSSENTSGKSDKAANTPVLRDVQGMLQLLANVSVASSTSSTSPATSSSASLSTPASATTDATTTADPPSSTAPLPTSTSTLALIAQPLAPPRRSTYSYTAHSQPITDPLWQLLLQIDVEQVLLQPVDVQPVALPLVEARGRENVAVPEPETVVDTDASLKSEAVASARKGDAASQIFHKLSCYTHNHTIVPAKTTVFTLLQTYYKYIIHAMADYKGKLVLRKSGHMQTSIIPIPSLLSLSVMKYQHRAAWFLAHRLAHASHMHAQPHIHTHTHTYTHTHIHPHRQPMLTRTPHGATKLTSLLPILPPYLPVVVPNSGHKSSSGSDNIVSTKTTTSASSTHTLSVLSVTDILAPLLGRVTPTLASARTRLLTLALLDVLSQQCAAPAMGMLVEMEEGEADTTTTTNTNTTPDSVTATVAVPSGRSSVGVGGSVGTSSDDATEAYGPMIELILANASTRDSSTASGETTAIRSGFRGSTTTLPLPLPNLQPASSEEDDNASPKSPESTKSRHPTLSRPPSASSSSASALVQAPAKAAPSPMLSSFSSSRHNIGYATDAPQRPHTPSHASRPSLTPASSGGSSGVSPALSLSTAPQAVSKTLMGTPILAPQHVPLPSVFSLGSVPTPNASLRSDSSLSNTPSTHESTIWSGNAEVHTAISHSLASFETVLTDAAMTTGTATHHTGAYGDTAGHRVGEVMSGNDTLFMQSISVRAGTGEVGMLAVPVDVKDVQTAVELEMAEGETQPEVQRRTRADVTGDQLDLEGKSSGNVEESRVLTSSLSLAQLLFALRKNKIVEIPNSQHLLHPNALSMLTFSSFLPSPISSLPDLGILLSDFSILPFFSRVATTTAPIYAPLREWLQKPVHSLLKNSGTQKQVDTSLSARCYSLASDPAYEVLKKALKLGLHEVALVQSLEPVLERKPSPVPTISGASGGVSNGAGLPPTYPTTNTHAPAASTSKAHVASLSAPADADVETAELGHMVIGEISVSSVLLLLPHHLPSLLCPGIEFLQSLHRLRTNHSLLGATAITNATPRKPRRRVDDEDVVVPIPATLAPNVTIADAIEVLLAGSHTLASAHTHSSSLSSSASCSSSSSMPSSASSASPSPSALIHPSQSAPHPHAWLLDNMGLPQCSVDATMLLDGLRAHITKCAGSISETVSESGKEEENLAVPSQSSYQNMPPIRPLMMSSEKSSIGMGDNTGMAILVDQHLQTAHSQPTYIFGNPPLAQQERFEIQAVECWGFR